MNIVPNAIFYSDCLEVLECMENESIDLIYLDPPWGNNIYDERLESFIEFLSKLFQQCRRILSDKGSVFFHIAPSVSAYVRILLDKIFGQSNFRTEFIVPEMKYSKYKLNLHAHESILMYSKSDNFVYNALTRELSPEEIKERYRYSDERGPFQLVSLTIPLNRVALRYVWNGKLPSPGSSWVYSKERLDKLEEDGLIYFSNNNQLPKLKRYASETTYDIGVFWNDLPKVLSKSEKTGFLTQQSIALMSRVIRIGTNPEAIILDPFIGSGTTIVAAENLNRKWIGCDSSDKAIMKSEKRLLENNIKYTLYSQKEILSTFNKINDLYVDIEFSLRPNKEKKFRLNHIFNDHESKFCEFKEIKGQNPIGSICNNIDIYVVAFLNKEGGSIYWGITDSREIVGVKLTYNEKDELNRKIQDKINSIVPYVSQGLIGVKFHNIIDTENCYIIEVNTPKIIKKDLFFTSGGEAYIKTESGKLLLKGPALQQEILRRFKLE